MELDHSRKNRELKRLHQQLLREWKRKKGPCIICGERQAIEKDHLPPKVLYPESARTDSTEFFTFPVCAVCNRSSSDEDFLLSVLLSVGLNQKSIVLNELPSDLDLLALYQQTLRHFGDRDEGSRRTQLLKPFIGNDPKSGKKAINTGRISVIQPLMKITKSIYWLHTQGDILHRYDCGWWIRSDINTAKPQFIEKHLKMTQADILWGDRFIARFAFGRPEDGVGGIIQCSLHFYTQKALGEGMSWLVFASPSETKINGKSLYEWSADMWGPATVEPMNIK